MQGRLAMAFLTSEDPKTAKRRETLNGMAYEACANRLPAIQIADVRVAGGSASGRVLCREKRRAWRNLEEELKVFPWKMPSLPGGRPRHRCR